MADVGLNLSTLSAEQVQQLGATIRQCGSACSSMEMAAGKIVGCLYDRLGTDGGDGKACALVRLYKTHAYGELPSDLQVFAANLLGEQSPTPSIKCLTLVATRGDKHEWNDRKRSTGHKAIPLASPQVVEKIPMVAQLIRQFGLEVSAVVQPSADMLLDAEQKTLNVFHVPEANGSPYIPAQSDFVKPCNIRSVVGFGSVLPSGDLFAVILFCKVPVARDVADRFTTLALNVKEAILPFDGRNVFS